MSKEATREELGMGDSFGYQTWLFIMRFLAPAAIFLVAVVTVLSY